MDFVSNFQIKAQSIKRYEGNPYVEGDNIAEHLSRVSRLLICLAPQLKAEFSNYPTLIEDIAVCLLVHDDDEVIDGGDIPTAFKAHNVKDEEEIAKFRVSVDSLPDSVREFLTVAFISFRKKDVLSAKIAKALDNISGNQLVIEQEIGLINPDQAKFSIEYVSKVKGISKTLDVVAEAQIRQIVEFRKYLKLHPGDVGDLLDSMGIEDSSEKKELLMKVKGLLEIDVVSHPLDRNKINVSLQGL